jgi:hypothetical protein
MKSHAVAMADQARSPLQSKYDLDQFLADSAKITGLPVESLPDVLAQVVSRVRTSTIRSKRPNGSSPKCPIRQRFSTQALRRSTARSQIELPCHRASFSRAPRNTTPQRCMRPSIMPILELCRSPRCNHTGRGSIQQSIGIIRSIF